MIYLKGSFETVMNRIKLRGRDFELDSSLIDYYRFLWEGYDDWVQNYYTASDILIIDTDHTDIVNREEDRLRVIQDVEWKLKQQRSEQ
mgnify:FL=1